MLAVVVIVVKEHTGLGKISLPSKHLLPAEERGREREAFESSSGQQQHIMRRTDLSCGASMAPFGTTGGFRGLFPELGGACGASTRFGASGSEIKGSRCDLERLDLVRKNRAGVPSQACQSSAQG